MVKQKSIQNNPSRNGNKCQIIQLPPQNKDYAIPKYSGFVPHAKAESIFGKVFTPVSRIGFSKKKLQLIPNLYFSTL